MTASNAFYGGGHSMRSASDFAYWCLRVCTNYQTRTDVFIPPRAEVTNDVQSYSRIANCLEQAGVALPMRYGDLYAWLQDNDAFVAPADAIRVRGAVLLNQGTVTVSLGDSRRVITESNYKLTMKFLNPSQDPQAAFEYAARIPGLDYL